MKQWVGGALVVGILCLSIQGAGVAAVPAISMEGEVIEGKSLSEAEEVSDKSMQIMDIVEKIAANPKEAIEFADTLGSIDKKIEYLVKQAQELWDSGKFKEVADIAQHILQYLNQNSQEAKSLLDDANQSLAQEAAKEEPVEAVASDAIKEIGSLEE